MGTVVAFAMLAALAIVPYNYGRGRWTSEWTRSIRGVSLMIFVILLPWLVVALALGVGQRLVPLAIVVLVAAWSLGFWHQWQGARRDRQQRRHDA